MKYHYLALTIGPTYKTLDQAKTTRELWVASYFLSKITSICINYKPLENYLLSPQQVIPYNTYGAGVYPDRVYWKLDKLFTDNEINTFNNDIIKDLYTECEGVLSKEDLKNYIKLYWVQCTYTQEEQNEEGRSFLFRINELLDGLELQNTTNQNGQLNLITKLIAKKLRKGLKRPIYKWRNESDHIALYQYVDNDNVSVKRYASITEIATTCFYNGNDQDKKWYKEHVIDRISNQLSEKDKAEDSDTKEENIISINETNLMLKIKNHYNQDKNNLRFRARHKYFCIVQSDGDGIGAFLSKEVANDTDKFKSFSETLNKFSIQCLKTVSDYGATPIYASGDDLLFFAPLKDQYEKETIVDLVEKLDSDFKKSFKDKSMSLSFGISITYYKFPLSESRAIATHQLYEKSKKESGKNYFSIQLQKHSGQQMGLGYNLSSDTYKIFKDLLNNASNSSETFINSIMYKLNDQKELINLIHSNTEKLKLFFKNNFNEEYNKYQSLFDNLSQFIHETYKMYSYEDDTQKLSRIYGSLRFIQFLNAEDHD